VRLIIDGHDVAGGVADLSRPSLAEAGIGDGRHGFRIELPPESISRGMHAVRVDAEGVVLPAAAGFGVAREDADDGPQFFVDGSARRSSGPPVVGRVEAAHGDVVSGWVWSPATPAWRIGVSVILDGSELGATVADLPLALLERAGVGDGRYGFRIELPAGTAGAPPRAIRVHTETGVTLPVSGGFASPDGGGELAYVAEVSPTRFR